MSKYNKTPLLIKCSGGKAAQILALSNAVYLSKKLRVDFRVVYFPHSTGTYWEFGLEELLYEKELYEIRKSPGIRLDEEIKHGAHIPNFPTRRGGLSYLKIFQLLNRLGLIKWLRICRREIAIEGSRKRLDLVTNRTRVVSGNFVPIVNDEVYEDLEKRLGEKVGVNPFSLQVATNSVVIHYRLGDMRISPFDHNSSSDSRVVDPEVYRNILSQVGFNFDVDRVHVVSDEPSVAGQLLASVGVKVNESSPEIGFWSDLNTMAAANILIGSLSQMSFLGAAICSRNGGQVFLPGDVFGEVDLASSLEIDSFNYYEIFYLKHSHWLFK
jgi:hypothetical protein